MMNAKGIEGRRKSGAPPVGAYAGAPFIRDVVLLSVALGISFFAWFFTMIALLIGVGGFS